MSNSDHRTIVITGASSRHIAFLIPYLYTQPNVQLRLIVNTPPSLQRLSSQYSKAEVIINDLAKAAALLPIIHDATHVYHFGPLLQVQEILHDHNMIDAAVAESRRPGNKFQHFVYSSSLNTQLDTLPGRSTKRSIEQYLMETDLNWTILKPGNVMDLPVGQCIKAALDAKEQGVQPIFLARWDPEIRNSTLALIDLGEASARVLLEDERHYSACYDLCSTPPIPYRSIYETVGKVVGAEFRPEVETYEDAVERMMVQFVSEDAKDISRDIVERLISYYRARGVKGNPNILEWLLGRQPTSVEDLATKMWETATQI